MNLSARLAGLFATSVFLVTAMPGFFKQVQPYDITQMAHDNISGVSLLETLLLSVGGAMAAGFIGYMVGDILTHPDTRRSKKKVYIKKQVKEFDPNAVQSLEEQPSAFPPYEPTLEVPTMPPLSAPPTPEAQVPPVPPTGEPSA